MMRKRSDIAVDIISRIDDDIVEKNLIKRFELWFSRGKKPKRNKWIPIIAAAACFCILLTSAFVLWNFLKAPVYLGMTVSKQAPSVNTAVADIDNIGPVEPLKLGAESAMLKPMYLSNDKNEQNDTQAPATDVTTPAATTEATTENPAPEIFESKLYYAAPGEDIYIYVHISNPNAYEILSFTLNGVKYSSYMFEEGSDLETLILKSNVGETLGLMQYTIDAIKYVDGDQIKDVRMKGDKTIDVVVGNTADALAMEIVEMGSALLMTPGLQDVIENFPDIVSVEVYRDTELVMECTRESYSLFSIPFDERLLLVVNYLDGDTPQKSMCVFNSPQESKGLKRLGSLPNIAGIGTCKDKILFLNDPIKQRAFEECPEDVVAIVLGKGVTSIGISAFSGCSPSTVVVIAQDNPVYRIENNCIIEKATNALANCIGKDIKIPDSVTGIGEGAFSNYTSLTSVTIPDSITSISASAFFNCTSLTSVTIPDSVTSIGEYAFSGCTSLTEVQLPDSITSMDAMAFYGCANLKTVTIGSGITSISPYSFVKSGLTHIIIPDNVTVIGTRAFDRCADLTDIDLPDGLTHIGDYAMRGCTGLSSITIPKSVTSIGSFAFAECSSLNDVSFEGTVEEWNAISKGYTCLYNIPATEIRCSNGTVAID